MLIPSCLMAMDYLANRIASFVSARMKDDVPVNGC